MGSKNSKVSPTSSCEVDNKQKLDVSPPANKVHGPPTSVPSVSSLVSGDSVKDKPSGPPIGLISNSKKTSPTSVAQTDDAVANMNSNGSGRRKGIFKEGDKILANFEGNGEWFPGVIGKAYDDMVYDINYDDGDVEESVPASDIKLRPRGVLGPLASSIPVATPSTTSDSTPPATISHKTSAIVRVQSSSKLFPDSSESNKENSQTPTGFGMNSTHSSSFKQLPPNGKRHSDTKPIPKPVIMKNAEMDDYGEYDGSLDFVPRKSSMQNVKANVLGDDDDEFASLDDEENQKYLTKSVLSGERSDSSAVIKNLYREDSKNTLLSPQYYEEKKAATATTTVNETSVVQPLDTSASANVDKGSKRDEKTEKREEKNDESTGQVTAEEECYQENIQEAAHNTADKGIEDEEDCGINKSKTKHKKKKKKQEREQEQLLQEEPTAVSHATHNSIIDPVHSNEPVSYEQQKPSEFKEVWDDDDLFGMNGMNIQRVESVESVAELEGDLVLEGGQGGGSYYDDYDHEQSYGHTSSEAGLSHNDSFFTPNEQSHAESFYSYPDQQQGEPDWGRISQQSANLYDQANLDQEMDQHHDQEGGGGGGYDHDAPTDSGWSLCYTADGAPYFYNYDLQESRWELPTTKKPPVQVLAQENVEEQHQEQMFQPVHGFSRPFTSASGSAGGGRPVSRGIVQSKHELAKALNSNANKCKSTLHLTNLIEDEDDDAPYDLGLGSMGMMQPLKKVSSTSRLKELPANGGGGKGMKRPQSMAAMRRKKKDVEF